MQRTLDEGVRWPALCSVLLRVEVRLPVRPGSDLWRSPGVDPDLPHRPARSGELPMRRLRPKPEGCHRYLIFSGVRMWPGKIHPDKAIRPPVRRFATDPPF